MRVLCFRDLCGRQTCVRLKFNVCMCKTHALLAACCLRRGENAKLLIEEWDGAMADFKHAHQLNQQVLYSTVLLYCTVMYTTVLSTAPHCVLLCLALHRTVLLCTDQTWALQCVASLHSSG